MEEAMDMFYSPMFTRILLPNEIIFLISLIVVETINIAEAHSSELKRGSV
jgi:hypothetical protein